MDTYGDFKETDTQDTQNVVVGQEAPARVRLPRKGEYIGVIVQRFGGNRMEVLSTDGKKRNCRVPGRFKRSLWLRPKDIVLVQPWVDDDSKGDLVYKYSSSAIYQLQKKGILASLRSDF